MELFDHHANSLRFVCEQLCLADSVIHDPTEARHVLGRIKDVTEELLREMMHCASNGDSQPPQVSHVSDTTTTRSSRKSSKAKKKKDESAPSPFEAPTPPTARKRRKRGTDERASANTKRRKKNVETADFRYGTWKIVHDRAFGIVESTNVKTMTAMSTQKIIFDTEGDEGTNAFSSMQFRRGKGGGEEQSKRA